MAAGQTDSPTPPTRWSRFRTSSHLPALVVTLIISVIAALFAASYSIAMGNPQPHDVPVAVVAADGAAAQAQEVEATARGAGYVVTQVSSVEEGLALIDDQQIYGLLSLPAADGADKPTLYVSSASGSSVARLLEADSASLGAQLGVTLDIVDTHPLAPNDPSGMALFYIALAAVIIGFVGALQTRANAPDMSLAADLAWDAARVVLAGFAITVAIGPILRIENLPVLPVWALLSVTMWMAGMTANVFRHLLGPRWGMLPTWIIFVLIANPSSGGAVAPQMLPAFYETASRLLPTGATISLLREIVYFPAYLHAEPFVVLGVWTVASTTAYVVLRVLGARRAARADGPRAGTGRRAEAAAAAAD